MKKRIMLLLTAVCLLISLAGCSGGGGSESNTSKDLSTENGSQGGTSGDKIVVGVSQCTTQEERWRNDGKALEALAQEMGIELKMMDAANDSATQATQIENLLSSGIDVLLVSPTDSEAIAPALAEVKSAGIPIVVWGRQVNSADQDFFIINNFTDVGVKMGEQALSVCPTGKYIIIGGDKSTSVPTEMTEGIMQSIGDAVNSGDIEIVYEQYITNWMPEDAMSSMENALTLCNNEVDLVICHNDGMAGGVIQALDGQGLAGQVPVIGMDAELAALQRIADGKQYSTMLFDHTGFAKVGLNVCYKLAMGESVDEYMTTSTTIEGTDIKTGDIPFIFITKDNMQEVCVDSGLHEYSDIYTN